MMLRNSNPNMLTEEFERAERQDREERRWHDHDGGPCPCWANDVEAYRLKDGGEVTTPHPAFIPWERVTAYQLKPEGEA